MNRLTPVLPSAVAGYQRHQSRPPVLAARSRSFAKAISAGAPVPAAVLERFSAMLTGDAQVFTPYGATESLPVCSIGSREVLAETRYLTDQGKGVCVGKPVDGSQTDVPRISFPMAVYVWEDEILEVLPGLGEPR